MELRGISWSSWAWSFLAKLMSSSPDTSESPNCIVSSRATTGFCSSFPSSTSTSLKTCPPVSPGRFSQPPGFPTTTLILMIMAIGTIEPPAVSYTHLTLPTKRIV
eukprot:TRINITY_DN63718_c0_g1_i1.p1 TRINITY_DN63718_c0_g1~~TRINITY_DN63718_c0_g1_i1.p1  ORF type:complete len:105 (-),score=15.53 TRINITY_DN63718_c0_g1_i1:92-406(-)